MWDAVSSRKVCRLLATYRTSLKVKAFGRSLSIFVRWILGVIPFVWRCFCKLSKVCPFTSLIIWKADLHICLPQKVFIYFTLFRGFFSCLPNPKWPNDHYFFFRFFFQFTNWVYIINNTWCAKIIKTYFWTNTPFIYHMNKAVLLLVVWMLFACIFITAEKKLCSVFHLFQKLHHWNFLAWSLLNSLCPSCRNVHLFENLAPTVLP